MTKDLAPPRQDLGGFVRWPASGVDGSTLVITFGSWLGFIPAAVLAIFASLCLMAPFLAIMLPGQPPLTLDDWFGVCGAWLFSALFFYAARSTLHMAEPSCLSLDLASRRYILRKGFQRTGKNWMGTFDDIQGIYVWKRWGRATECCIYNVNIYWEMKGGVTSLWTYYSKRADDPKPEAWAENFCRELGVPFGGVLTGKYFKTWKSP